MPTYSNGRVPYTVVSVVLAKGTDSNGYWEFRCTPAFAARWAFAKREAERRFGRTIYIRTGWNIYRPYDVQYAARRRACASGNCNGAAVEGSSSHGGNWGGRDCLAVDVDPNGLTWDQVDQAMEAAGFSARLITEAMSGIKGGERWHYIDFNAFGAIPAGMNAKPFEEDDMPLNADTDYPAFRDMLFRALKWDVRTNGAGPDWNLGPTVWERFNSVEAAAKASNVSPEQVKAIADAIIAKIQVPAPVIDYAAVAKAVNDDAAGRMKS
jgi:hypothetical protein